MTRLALFGAGGHGKVVADAALKAGWSDIVFFDDAWPQRTINGHWPVAGNFDALMGHAHLFESVHVSIGNCSVRWRKQQELRAAGVTLATVVHPQACVSQFAQIGAGSVVMAGAVVNVDTVIGEACIINTGVTVDHDCHLAAGVHVCPGAHLSGGVTVGARLMDWCWCSCAARYLHRSRYNDWSWGRYRESRRRWFDYGRLSCNAYASALIDCEL